MPSPTQPHEQPESRGLRPRFPLGLGLCCAALGVNRWSLGWLLSSDGELTGVVPNLLLGAAQMAVFCLGTALLRRRGRGRLERALGDRTWTALGLAAFGVGLLGAALTAAPFRGTERLKAELALVAGLFDGEELEARLEAALAELSEDLADGRLDGSARSLCAARVAVADAVELPVGESVSWNAVVGRRRFGSGPERTVEGGTVELLAPLSSGGARLVGGRARALGRELTPGAPGRRPEARTWVEWSARLALGERSESVTAWLEFAWSGPGAGDPPAASWRLTAVTVLAAEVLHAPGALFEAAPGPALPPGVRIADLCIADLDGDGREDLYLATTAGPNLALLERGPGRYEERGRELGLDLAEPSRAAAAADFDHDGRDELLVGRDGAPALWLEAGGDGVFRPRGAGDWPADVSSIALGDLDGDGWLDAVLGVGTQTPAGELDWRGTGAPAVTGGPSSALLRNRAGADLELAWPDDPSLFAGHALQAALADWDGDGDLDLCLAVDLGGVRFLANDGTGRFRAAAEGFAPALGPAARALAFGDHDGDGRLDLFAARRAQPGAARALALLGRPVPEVGGALLWNARVGFERVFGAESEALARSQSAGRAAFVDLDGDGRLDLSVAAGQAQERGAAWWRRARFGPEGRGLLDPRARSAYLERERRARPARPGTPEPGLLFLNAERAGPRFEPASGLAPCLDSGARVLAWLDLDGDVLPDALVAASGPGGDVLTPCLNRIGALAASPARGLAIRLEGGERGGAGTGRWSSRGGHGARIEVHDGAGRLLWRVHRAPELQGQAGGALTLVGLGTDTAARLVRVSWPSGRVQESFDVPSGALVTFHEDPAGSPTGGAAVLRPYRPQAPGQVPGQAPGPAAPDPLLRSDPRGTTIEDRPAGAAEPPDPRQ